MIRVAILAGSNLVRTGLEALVRGDAGLEIAGLFARPADLQGAPADVALAAPAEGLLDLAAQPGAPAVVVISEDPDPASTAEALAAGCYAVLPADASAEEVRAAIRAAAAGLVSMRRADFLPRLAEDHAAPPDGSLSPREIEVLRLLAEGMPNKTIAWKLGISEHTVKFHVASILTRLNASSRAQAVAIGIRRGLIMV